MNWKKIFLIALLLFGIVIASADVEIQEGSFEKGASFVILNDSGTVKTFYGNGTLFYSNTSANSGTVINTVDSATNGGIIYVKSNPAGVYTIDQKVVLNSTNKLIGENKNTTILKAKTNLNDRLIVNYARDAGSETDYSIEISGFTFDVNGANQGASTALTFSRTDGLKISDCNFINAYDSLLMITGSPDVTLNKNVKIRDNDFNGTGQVDSTDLNDLGSATNLEISSNNFKDAKPGGYTMLSLAIIDDLKLVGNSFDGKNNGATLRVSGIKDGTVTLNNINGSAEAGIRIDPWVEVLPYKMTDNLRITENSIHNNSWEGIWIRWGDAVNTTKHLNINNNDIYWNNKDAIYVRQGEDIQIKDNNIYENNLTGTGIAAIAFSRAGAGYEPRNIDISGNIIDDKQSTKTQTRAFYFDYTYDVAINHNRLLNYTIAITQSNSLNITYSDNWGLSPFYWGTRSTSPTPFGASDWFYNTTDKHPGWYNGTHWVKADGTTILNW